MTMFVACTFLSCGQLASPYMKELKKAESLVYTRPDSALFLLEQLPDSIIMQETYQKNLYRELMDEARKMIPLSEAERQATRYTNEAFRYLREDNHVQGMEMYLKALKTLKQDTASSDIGRDMKRLCCLAIGRAYTRTGEYAQAMKIYQEYMAYTPGNDSILDYVIPYQGMAEVHERTAQYDSAVTYYRKALEHGGENHVYWKHALHSGIYRIYLQRGDKDSAQAYYRRMTKAGYRISSDEPIYLKDKVPHLTGNVGYHAGNASPWWWVAAVLLTAGIIASVFLYRRKRKAQPFPAQPSPATSAEPASSLPLEEALQTGIRHFYASAWHGMLETADKEIASGDYMKVNEQKELYQELDACFTDFINSLCTACPGINQEDIYYCILSHLDYRNRVIVYAMRASSGTLRTRKSRLKKAMPEDTFKVIFK